VTDGKDTYKQIRALKRGLDVLVELNAVPGASIATLSVRTGIHRTTLYRLLETLEELGYLRRSPTNDSYRLTSQVRRLSDGYDVGERIAEAASDCLNQLLREINWPSSVATPRLDAMVIRETTHGRTELFVHDVRVGTRSPILTTAMGRAYLAHCGNDERQEIVARVAASESPEAPLARDGGYVKRIVETTREAGFGLSYGDARPALGSVALPIRADGRVVGGVNVVFFTGVVGRQWAVRNFVPALTRTATTIERTLARC